MYRILTIKLNGVVLDALCESAVRLGAENTRLLGLGLVDPQNDHDGDGEQDKDDAKDDESPAEVEVGVERTGDGRAGKGCDDGGEVVERKDNHPVAKSGDIGDKDIDDIQGVDVTDPVEGMSSSVRLNVLACRLHDHANGNEGDAKDETLHAASEVDPLANGQGEDTTDGAAGNADGTEETVLAKVGRDVGRERALDGAQEVGSEAKEP